MYNQHNELGESPSFNMAVRFVDRLDKRNDEIDQFFVRTDLISVNRNLRNIYLMIKFKMLKEPEKDLFGKKYTELIKDIETLFKVIENSLKKEDKKLLALNISFTEIKLNELREMIYNVLWNEHFIFPEKIKLTYEEEIEADFK